MARLICFLQKAAGAIVVLTTTLIVPASFATAGDAGLRCAAVNPTAIALPDPVSGRKYEIYVSLPANYSQNPTTSYPLVVLADGGRASPKLSCEAHAAAERMNSDEAIVVGLSYATGEDLEDSRRRDYTPTELKGSRKVYGGAASYQAYLANVVLPYIEQHYRIASGRRIFWGHSYGGLFGAHILLTDPALFQTYILGSPSFWFAEGAILDLEARYANDHRQLDATLLLYVGGLEIAKYDPARKGKTRDMIAGMRQFEARLQSRHYPGLKIESTIIAGKDHRSSVRPGFVWGMEAAFRN